MHRRRRVASALAMLILAATAAPLAAPAPTVAAGECGTYASETVPPATIRVFRTASGAVDVVDFRTYSKNVLSREWISSWTTESLRAGALAVKHYAWYQVLHWRGYVNAAGECFDIFDSTRDQHYDPTRPTYASMAAAVDATWGTLALQGGRIFPTYYNAGAPGEACGTNANGWRMYQWGSQGCGLIGKTAAQIMAVYYAGVTVSAAPPPVIPPPTPVPSPTPVATPVPTPVATPQPTPMPSTPGSTPPSSTPVPTSLPTPVPTPVPTAVATPTPTPPPVVEPGGGQSGIVNAPAPPPPPPPNPEPIVVAAGAVAAAAEEPDVRDVTAPLPAWQRRGFAATRTLEWSERHHRVGFAWPARPPEVGTAVHSDTRLVMFRAVLGDVAADLVRAMTAGLRAEPLVALVLRRP